MRLASRQSNILSLVVSSNKHDAASRARESMARRNCDCYLNLGRGLELSPDQVLLLSVV